jgi:hypothetical protein
MPTPVSKLLVGNYGKTIHAGEEFVAFEKNSV